MQLKVPSDCVLRTDNPNATITSSHTGFPPGFENRHLLGGSNTTPEMQLTLDALQRCHYQCAEDAYADIPQHTEVYLGDELHVRVFVDRHGKVGTVTLPEYAIRRPGTIRALQTTSGYPRQQAATPCDLTDRNIVEIVLAAIESGIPFSYSVVRTKFGRYRSGDVLMFWPSWAPFYGAAACDKLGTSVDLESFTEAGPLDPRVIHVCIPWLSKQFFGGVYTICCGSGRKRLLVVNGGWYDGGCKKPITFQNSCRRLPRHSPFITTHWAMTELLNGSVMAIGTTTAAGKSEGSSDEMHLETPGLLTWNPTAGGEDVNPVHVRIGRGSPLVASYVGRSRRRVVSDDITAVAVGFNGVPHGVELEPVHFYRTDLCTRAGTLPIAEAASRGDLDGRVYWYNTKYDETKQQFVPWGHVMLGTTDQCTNPRLSYPVDSNRDFVATSPEDPRKIDWLVLSVPVPKMPKGWHLPTFLRVSVSDFFAQNCHGARANKGNPALGAVGDGYWAFEGFGGKAGFTLDTEAEMLSRDLKFWESLNHQTPCFVVFNGYSMGMEQAFKYSGTFLLRALCEHWGEQLLRAPLLEVPGVFSGGVPDLGTFLPEGALDPRAWDPRTLDREALLRDANTLDLFCYVAMNKILGQSGLGPGGIQLLGDLMRKYSRSTSRLTLGGN